MTNKEAGRLRACIGCGTPGAWLCRTTKGENPGRNLRLCQECLRADPNWFDFGLADRDPLPIEITPEETWEMALRNGMPPSGRHG
jgi:hypothetical protein